MSMFLNIVFSPSDKTSREIASNKGLADFCKWCQSLDKFPLVKQLASGQGQGGKKLLDQLKAAVKASPPNASAGAVAKRILQVAPLDDAKLSFSDEPIDSDEEE